LKEHYFLDITKAQKIKNLQNSYNDYRSIYNRFVGGSPHDAMKYFVKNNTQEDIWIVYKEIYDVCHDSRYKNYHITDEDLKIAQEALESIRRYCVENQQ